jgi:hypothetical protein
MPEGRPAPLDRPFQVAIYVLPVASVLIAALVFLGPGAEHATVAARVRGSPAEGSRSIALRAEVLRSVHDVAEPVALGDLTATATLPGQALPIWRGAAGSDGIAEVVLEGSTPLQKTIAIAITAPGESGKRLLVQGEIPLRKAPSPFVQLGAIRGTTKGTLEIRVDATRGVMASPFPEAIRVSVTRGGAPLGTKVELALSGEGMEIVPKALTTGEAGVGTATIKALAHNVDLAIVARAGDEQARWEGTLPVVPGAMWIDPASVRGPLSIVSAAPRPRAYLSLWSADGRTFGAVVPLARDDFGFFRGRVEIPRPGSKLTYATVAGDALEQGSGTVAWPLQPSEGAVSGEHAMTLLLDGLPAAKARERARAWSARRAGLVLLGMAALAEVLLILLQSRAYQRTLEAHLREASDKGADGEGLSQADRDKLLGSATEHPALRAIVMVCLVALAFAMMAALATFR